MTYCRMRPNCYRTTKQPRGEHFYFGVRMRPWRKLWPFLLETAMMYKTHLRGFTFFLDVTGACFEGRYPCKRSDIEEAAIEIMAPEWVREPLVN